MKLLKSEKNIINVIKYGPIFFVIVLSFLITKIIIEQKNTYLNEEIIKIEKDFLHRNKQRVKDEVLRVYNSIKKEKLISEKLLKIEIKNRTYEAYQIAKHIYIEESKEDVEGHIHSEEHKFQTIKNALGGIIYNKGRGYFYIFDKKGKVYLQPLHEELEGKEFLEFEDAKGYKFVRKIVNTIRNKSEAYDSYYWYKANDSVNTYKKISFYKYFEPFDIAIGTGEYVEDFEKELQTKLLKRIKDIRYSNNKYIYIFDLKGKGLSHYKDELIGINRLNEKNTDGKYLIKDIINFAKNNKEGFFEYTATFNPNKQLKSNKKIAFLKLFEEWNWVIGSGFYLDNLNKELDERKLVLKKSNETAVKNVIMISFLITILFVLISFYISKLLTIKFKQYKLDIKKEIKKSFEKEKLLIQQSKMATMGEMIGNIAHQWKQPLSLISTSNGLLRLDKEFKNFSEKDVRNAMDSIDNSVQNLSETIDDFRNFFNPNKTKKRFFINDAFDKTFKLIESQFKNNNIEIIKNIENLEISSYENELLQTLINILKNAKEELVVKDELTRKLLFIDCTKKDDKLEISIKDNAGGIPIDIKEKIFDSYFTTKEDNGGTGIGLYMSKQIIEDSMDGKLLVSNVEFLYDDIKYQGAEFRIIIPYE